MDRVMNIQENKNQHNGESIPVNFTRLVKAIKKKKANEIWTYFQTILRDVGVVNEEESDEEEMAAEEVATESPPVEPVSPPMPPTTEESNAAADSDIEMESVPESQTISEENTTPAEENVRESAGVDAPVQTSTVSDEREHSPAQPHNVRPFRRGGVHGYELKDELQRILAILDSYILYKHPQYVELFNLLGQM
jgi:hypothetical protein